MEEGDKERGFLDTLVIREVCCILDSPWLQTLRSASSLCSRVIQKNTASLFDLQNVKNVLSVFLLTRTLFF